MARAAEQDAEAAKWMGQISLEAQGTGEEAAEEAQARQMTLCPRSSHPPSLLHLKSIVSMKAVYDTTSRLSNDATWSQDFEDRCLT